MIKLVKNLQWACLPLGMLVFSNSGAFEEIGKTSVDLTGVEMPAQREVGSKVVRLRNGEEVVYTVTSVEEGSIHLKSSQGCAYEQALIANNYPSLAPSLSWDNCAKSSGHAKVETKGELFPIAKKNKIVYNVSGTVTSGAWTGNWSDRRVCKVKSQVRVSTVGGEFDTWKIICKGKNDKRTYYYSPELGAIAAMKRRHYKDSTKNLKTEWIRSE